MKNILIILCCICIGNKNASATVNEHKIKFDYNWKFSKGDFPDAAKKKFDDSKWMTIDVPHDWSILDTFSKANPSGNSGGFASGGVGWYRKYFTLDKNNKSSNISIEFGGVYENSEVWING